MPIHVETNQPPHGPVIHLKEGMPSERGLYVPGQKFRNSELNIKEGLSSPAKEILKKPTILILQVKKPFSLTTQKGVLNFRKRERIVVKIEPAIGRRFHRQVTIIFHDRNSKIKTLLSFAQIKQIKNHTTQKIESPKVRVSDRIVTNSNLYTTKRIQATTDYRGGGKTIKIPANTRLKVAKPTYPVGLSGKKKGNVLKSPFLQSLVACYYNGKLVFAPLKNLTPEKPWGETHGKWPNLNIPKLSRGQIVQLSGNHFRRKYTIRPRKIEFAAKHIELTLKEAKIDPYAGKYRRVRYVNGLEILEYRVELTYTQKAVNKLGFSIYTLFDKHIYKWIPREDIHPISQSQLRKQYAITEGYDEWVAKQALALIGFANQAPSPEKDLVGDTVTASMQKHPDFNPKGPIDKPVKPYRA